MNQRLMKNREPPFKNLSNTIHEFIFKNDKPIVEIIGVQVNLAMLN